jgi:hypothetical protein
MFWMRAYPLQGQVGGGWALEFKSFLGPVKWHRADREVSFGAQQTQNIMHRAVQIIVHRWFYAQEPRREVSGPITEGWNRCIKELVRPARAAPPHYKTY